MTATTTFVTDSVEGVLTVPNSALRYQPTPAAGEAKGTGPALWTVGAQGRPVRLAVRTGLTDGQRTQVSGAGVAQGLRVIVGAGAGGATRTSSSGGRSSTSSPFQAPTQSRRGPQGPF
jgi:HlyD family secretion protein